MEGRLLVAPIVEGHGEVPAIRILLERIWWEILQGDFVRVLPAIRWPRSELIQARELETAIQFAVKKLDQSQSGTDRRLILVLLDADDDLPCVLGPQLTEMARGRRQDVDITCVVANVEYESWFVAAAPSLGMDLKLEPGELERKPEQDRLGKGWIEKRFRGTYKETVDQPALTAKMDLALCRSRSPSFDKLCRELEARRNA
jgi:hypothetical protein